MNNSIYYHLFDSIVNTYLIERCGLVPQTSPLIGLVVSSFCKVQFFAPVGFPEVLDLGLRQGVDSPAAVGGYTHVFVGSESRKSTPMSEQTREGLSMLLALGTRNAKL
ncbi:hypothetical protein MD484_g5812, partial [Candolleomyces efflorescens]